MATVGCHYATNQLLCIKILLMYVWSCDDKSTDFLCAMFVVLVVVTVSYQLLFSDIEIMQLFIVQINNNNNSMTMFMVLSS